MHSRKSFRSAPQQQKIPAAIAEAYVNKKEAIRVDFPESKKRKRSASRMVKGLNALAFLLVPEQLGGDPSLDLCAIHVEAHGISIWLSHDALQLAGGREGIEHEFERIVLAAGALKRATAIPAAQFAWNAWATERNKLGASTVSRAHEIAEGLSKYDAEVFIFDTRLEIPCEHYVAVKELPEDRYWIGKLTALHLEKRAGKIKLELDGKKRNVDFICRDDDVFEEILEGKGPRDYRLHGRPLVDLSSPHPDQLRRIMVAHAEPLRDV